MDKVFKADLYRYYGEKGESLIYRLFRPKELCYIRLLRKAQGTGNKLMRALYTARLKRFSMRTQIQIPARTKIGEGFYIGHLGSLVINPDAVIGKNVNVALGVIIGAENRGKRKGCPTIGDRCWIGTNAAVVGNVKIGSDVLIAPLAYVNFDVPDHSIVIGNPGRIIHKDNATEAYIQNTI